MIIPRKSPSNCCPTCGRPIPPDGLRLSPLRQRVLNLVEQYGEISGALLYNEIWGSDPNGGPSLSTLYVTIYQLNKQLAPHGMAIRGGHGGHWGTNAGYRLIAEAAE